MKIIFTLMVLSFSSFNLYSSECGELKLKGTLSKNPKNNILEFNVLEDTNSKRTYTFPDQKVALEVTPFIGKQLHLTVEVIKKYDGTRGQINSISFIDVIFNSNLEMKNTAIQVLKEQKCEV